MTLEQLRIELGRACSINGSDVPELYVQKAHTGSIESIFRGHLMYAGAVISIPGEIDAYVRRTALARGRQVFEGLSKD